ncbi:MAG: D-lyxose/D-mannose family sugar isomerase [Clostridia bacterium]|nr:D-lyxose/D-mannose family sugar isomerase [Clostridia bacterium]
MISRKEFNEAVSYTIDFMKQNGIAITKEEEKKIEVADFGLSRLKKEGLQILTYVNTKRCCAKELVMYPNQTCPEHRHPMVDGQPGKEETFRCRVGTVYLYVKGTKSEDIRATVPGSSYTVFHQITLHEGEQFTLPPDTLHWFQSGDQGAIVSEFSTSSYDEYDIFTDQSVKRSTEIGD